MTTLQAQLIGFVEERDLKLYPETPTTKPVEMTFYRNFLDNDEKQTNYRLDVATFLSTKNSSKDSVRFDRFQIITHPSNP